MLDHGVTAKQAHLPVLRLHRCRLDHPAMPAFAGDGLRVDGDLVLDAAVVTAESKLGSVRLEAARIGGQLGLKITHLFYFGPEHRWPPPRARRRAAKPHTRYGARTIRLVVQPPESIIVRARLR